jgi:hypothetical protein
LESVAEAPTLFASANRIDEEELEHQVEKAARAAGFGVVPESWQQRIFLLLDEPSSSYCAGVIGFLMISLIAVSSVCLVIQTHPTLGPCADEEYAEAMGFLSAEEACTHWGTSVPRAQWWADTILLVESAVVLSFTVELMLRASLCRHRPRKQRSVLAYVKRPTFIVDTISVVPWWIDRATGDRSGIAIIRMMRMGRIFRLLKAANFIKELQLFLWAYYRAREGLLLLFLLLLTYLAVSGAVSQIKPSAWLCP